MLVREGKKLLENQLNYVSILAKFYMGFVINCQLNLEKGALIVKNTYKQPFSLIWVLSLADLDHRNWVSQVIACPIAFILLCDPFQLGGKLKPKKNGTFLVFLAVVVRFLKILGSS